MLLCHYTYGSWAPQGKLPLLCGTLRTTFHWGFELEVAEPHEEAIILPNFGSQRVGEKKKKGGLLETPTTPPKKMRWWGLGLEFYKDQINIHLDLAWKNLSILNLKRLSEMEMEHNWIGCIEKNWTLKSLNGKK